LNRILQLEPNNIAALKLMGNVAIAQGDTSRAIKYLHKVAEYEPDQAESHTKLGLGLMLEGEGESGAITLKKAIELDSNSELVEFVLISHQLNKGELQAALDAAKDFTARYPEAALAWNSLAMVQLKSEQIDEAIGTFQHVLKIKPGELGASSSLAALAMTKNNTTEAIQYYETALTYHPAHTLTLTRLARLKWRLGRGAEMQPLLEEVLKQRPDSLETRVLLADLYIRAKKPERALTLLMEVNNDDTRSPLYIGTLGSAQMAAGQTTEAAANFERLVALRPTVSFYLKLAQAYAKLGDTAKLDSTLDHILQREPNHLTAQVMKLKVLIHNKEQQQASELLRELKNTAPNNPELYIQEAKLALLNSDPKSAIKANQQAFKLAPSSKTVSALALAYWQDGKQKTSVQTMTNWLAENPDDLVVQYNLANLYLLAHQHDKARQALTAFVKQRPNHVAALTNLALLTKESNLELALKHGEKAFHLAPETPLVQDMMGQLLLEQGKNTRARRLFEKALQQAPRDPTINYHWAQALALTGDKEKAIQTLATILDREQSFQGKKDAHLLLSQLTGG